MGESLLVNYWYAPPVGHALEGLRYALGYKTANPELSVSLLLNSATAVELAGCCSFLEKVYAVPFAGFTEVDGDPFEALEGVPERWDWIVENHRAGEPSHAAFAGFGAFFDAAHARLRSHNALGVAGREPPGYVPHQRLRLELPQRARDAAVAALAGQRAIAIVLAGSSAARHLYPSASSWELILSALAERHPGAALLLVGKHVRDGQTTSRIGREELERLLGAVPATVDCFDRPLLEQVALVEASDLLVSPHTGFAFVASTVGTPWLAISGGQWHEYFFNGEPVYSLLPDPERYPAFTWGGLDGRRLQVIEADEDGEGPRTPSMSAARIRADLSELLRAADALIQGQLTAETALADYFPRLLASYGGDRGRVFSFDRIAERYLPPRG